MNYPKIFISLILAFCVCSFAQQPQISFNGVEGSDIWVWVEAENSLLGGPGTSLGFRDTTGVSGWWSNPNKVDNPYQATDRRIEFGFWAPCKMRQANMVFRYGNSHAKSSFVYLDDSTVASGELMAVSTSSWPMPNHMDENEAVSIGVVEQGSHTVKLINNSYCERTWDGFFVFGVNDPNEPNSLPAANELNFSVENQIVNYGSGLYYPKEPMSKDFPEVGTSVTPSVSMTGDGILRVYLNGVLYTGQTIDQPGVYRLVAIVEDASHRILSMAGANFKVRASKKILSKVTIDGLAGAQHWIWVEAEDHDSGNVLNIYHNRGTSYLSGWEASYPYSECMVQNRSEGSNADGVFGFSEYNYALPADMSDAKVKLYYASYYGYSWQLLWDGIEYQMPVPQAKAVESYAIMPYTWTDGFSIGQTQQGPHNISMGRNGGYELFTCDGVLISDGDCIGGSNIGYDSSGWKWRVAPESVAPYDWKVADNNPTAAISISDPIAEANIYLDDDLIQSVTEAGIYEVEISGGGEHQLVVEVFSLIDTEKGAPVNRVLCGANFVIPTCESQGVYFDGDVNEDCYVDIRDYSQLADRWLYNPDLNSHDLTETYLTEVNIEFPLGWYDSITPFGLSDIAAASFNCTSPYGTRWGYLNMAYENNLGVIQRAEGEGSALTDMVNDYKRSPSLIAWSLYDEPINAAVSVNDFAAKYNIVKTADPDSSITSVFCITDSRIDPYLPYLDYAMVDNYPILENDAVPSPNLYKAVVTSKIIVDKSIIAGIGAPVFVSQAFGGYGNPVRREPTGFEAKYMTYAPITVGIRGIMYYSRFDVSETLKGDIELIANRLSTLIPAILNGQTGVSIVSNYDNDTTGHGINDITHLLCHTVENSDDIYYLIAANNTNSQLANVQFDMSGFNGDIVEVMDESRSLTMSGSFLSDSFGPFEVHIYKIIK